jgi:hypothetical protein
MMPSRTPSLPSNRPAHLCALTLSLLLPVLALVGCGDDGEATTGGGGSGAGGPGPATSTSSGDGGAGGDSSGSLVTATGSTGTGTVECEVPCESGEICSHGTCVPGAACDGDDDCDFDTRCDAETGTCQPWTEAEPAHDEACVQLIPPGILAPAVRCEFSEAPPGDPFPGHVDVQGTPVVVNFNVPSDAGPPSIAASFTPTYTAAQGSYSEGEGVIRVLRGTDCSLEVNLGGVDYDGDDTPEWTVSSASLAVGDLDGDASAEIVAFGRDGSLLAFTRKAGVWDLLWKAPRPDGAPWNACAQVGGFPLVDRCSLGWAGPSIHDLDDDGVPEIIREGVVFDGPTGALRAGAPPLYASAGSGLFPTLADLDADGIVELTNGQRIWEYVADAWSEDPAFDAAGDKGPGLTAFADFGPYGSSGVASEPEIVVVRGSDVYLYALDGALVFGPIAVPGNGGGAPTISDFDGDGLAEAAVAGQAYYTVYDPDCGATPRDGGACALGPCDLDGATCTAGAGILWSRRTQDISSNVTGSSIFDFEADGSSEVVYGDECFTRVYNGQTGDVLFSQYRSSCTWYENPIIADVDGNFRADLVSPSNRACSPDGQGTACLAETLTAEGVDRQFNGLRCEEDDDCVSGACDAGLCRCTASAECCADGTDAACEEVGYRCAPPNEGTPGAGNTCRALHPHGVSGIRVYSDINDQWVRSRTIWNQHAYHVTHVNEDGTIPRTSEWTANWLEDDLNNFRQNVPGDPNANAIPDATAGAFLFERCSGTAAVLEIDVCNRGAAPVGAGVPVGFYVEGELVCEAATEGPLEPEECERVECTWSSPPTSEASAVDVDVVVNEGGDIAECKGGNNDGIVQTVYCESVN